VKTRSTAEAMNTLSAQRHRLITYGRYVATEICKARGSVHSRDVRRALGAMGMLTNDVGDYWLGAVFNRSAFEWTGAQHTYSDGARNIHERTIKVWRLAKGAEGYALPVDMPVFKAAPLSVELW
jgi:hypothetical protein